MLFTKLCTTVHEHMHTSNATQIHCKRLLATLMYVCWRMCMCVASHVQTSGWRQQWKNYSSWYTRACLYIEKIAQQSIVHTHWRNVTSYIRIYDHKHAHIHEIHRHSLISNVRFSDFLPYSVGYHGFSVSIQQVADSIQSDTSGSSDWSCVLYVIALRLWDTKNKRYYTTIERLSGCVRVYHSH